MTKSREEGENEFTRQAKREAMRTGEEVASILERMLQLAKQQKDAEMRMKVIRAQKFVEERNVGKRRRRK
jgi:hypothetical protein